MSKKSLDMYRPSWTASQIGILTTLVESHMRGNYLSPEDSVIYSEIHLKLKKEQVKASIGIGSAYKLKSDDERVRARRESITLASLGGSVIGGISDKEKLAAMNELEETVFWLNADVDAGARTREEADAEIEKLKLAALNRLTPDLEASNSSSEWKLSESEISEINTTESHSYVSGVIPRNEIYDSGIEVKEVTDTELFAAISKIRDSDELKHGHPVTVKESETK